MKNINFVTNFNNGLNVNHKLLNKEQMYKTEHSGSYFKYIYDKLESGFILEQSTTTIIAYEDYKPIGVLIFFHSMEKNSFNLDFSRCNNIGTIGLFIKKEQRGNGIAKKLIKEFENNFINFYLSLYDFIIVNTLEDSYPIANKYFEWFIPCQKQNCNIQATQNISNAINNGKKGLNTYLYQKSRSRLY